MTVMVSARDVENAVGRLADELIRVGIPVGRGLSLQKGSPTYGRAWRLYKISSEHGGQESFDFIDGGGYIGWTAREAYMTVTGLTNGMWAARAALKGS